MRAKRYKLHIELSAIIGAGHAYFQPPEGDEIERPCIIYMLSQLKPKYADNRVYNRHVGYQIMLVDEDPDSDFVDQILDAFTHIRFDRFYVADSLNHWVFTLYY